MKNKEKKKKPEIFSEKKKKSVSETPTIQI